MGVVSVPGMSLDKSILRRRGIIAVVVVVVVVLVIWLVQHFWPKNEFDLTLRTPTVAAGIVKGAPVKLNGLEIGKVSDVESLGNGQQGVVLAMDPNQVDRLTDSVEAAFSAGNLFGVAEVELIPHDGGTVLKNGAELTPTTPITDNTVSNIITTLGDVNDDAIRPHMSEIMLNLDTSTKAMLPLVTALGTVAQAVQDTQRLSTSETFPTIARIAQAGDQAASALIPALVALDGDQNLHSQAWVQRELASEDAITNHSDSLSARLQQILNPTSVKGLAEATPVLTAAMEPLLTTFPDAGKVGIQIGQLIDNIRAGMPNTPDGPVLNVNLETLYPAIGVGLPPVPTFQVVAPNPGAPSQAGRPTVAAKPTSLTSPAPSKPAAPAGPASTPTSKAGN